MKQWFSCEDDISELRYIDPYLLTMFCEAMIFANLLGKTLCITSLLREHGDGISKSATHQEGRAIDLSVKGWKDFEIKALADHLNKKFASTIGTAPEGKAPIACYYHNSGEGYHFHLQVRRGLSKTKLDVDIL